MEPKWSTEYFETLEPGFPITGESYELLLLRFKRTSGEKGLKYGESLRKLIPSHENSQNEVAKSKKYLHNLRWDISAHLPKYGDTALLNIAGSDGCHTI